MGHISLEIYTFRTASFIFDRSFNMQKIKPQSRLAPSQLMLQQYGERILLLKVSLKLRKKINDTETICICDYRIVTLKADRITLLEPATVGLSNIRADFDWRSSSVTPRERPR